MGIVPAPRLLKTRTAIVLLIALVLAPVLLLAGLLYASKQRVPPPDTIHFQEGMVYGKGGDQDLKLDLARPKNAPAAKLPAIVMIHGGGWTAGDRRDFHGLQFHLAQAGVVCVTVQYRLAPKSKFPAQVEDVKCAVRWLRAHADEFGVDPERIAALGASAGAHLAVMLAVTSDQSQLEGAGGNAGFSSKVVAAVGLAGPYDLTLAYANSPRQRAQEGQAVRGMLEGFLGGTPAQVAEAYQVASPVSYVRKEVAPLFLCHGEQDPLVPVEQADVMVAKLREAGAEVEYVKIPDGSHDSFGKDQEKHLLKMVAFLRRNLKM
jgi:acetyl esterase/lipase